MKISCTLNGHTRSAGLKTSTTSSFNHKSHSMGQHSSQNGDKLSNSGKKFEPFQIQQLIYYYSFSMHFIEQIFLFMNSVFNIFITLGNRPDPILIFQHSHNFSSITNLCLISGFPKDPIFPWEWGSIPDPYRLQSWRAPNAEPALNVNSLQHKLLSFFSLSLICVSMYMNTVLWSVMNLTLCCKENGHCLAQFGFLL